MACYIFRCEKCGNEKEVRQSFYQTPPACCEQPMERKMSAVNSTFGWRFSETSHLPRHERPPGHKNDELVRNV